MHWLSPSAAMMGGEYTVAILGNEALPIIKHRPARPISTTTKPSTCATTPRYLLSVRLVG
jgi:hypothetical protein